MEETKMVMSDIQAEAAVNALEPVVSTNNAPIPTPDDIPVMDAPGDMGIGTAILVVSGVAVGVAGLFCVGKYLWTHRKGGYLPLPGKKHPEIEEKDEEEDEE